MLIFRIFTELFDGRHFDPRSFHEKTVVDAASVVAFDQKCLIFRISGTGGGRIGIDLFRQSGQSVDVLDLDLTDDVRLTHDISNGGRYLF